jgi:hypothetical protein
MMPRNPLEAGPRIFMTPAIRRGRQARIGRNGSEKGHADFLQSQSQEIFYYFYILRNILQASDCDELEKVPLKARVTNFGASSISPLIGFCLTLCCKVAYGGNMRARRSSGPARPYIARLRVFIPAALTFDSAALRNRSLS